MNNNSSTNENTPSQNQDNITDTDNDAALHNIESSKKKKKKNIIIGIISFLVMIGVGTYFYLDYKSNETKVYVADDNEEEKVGTIPDEYIYKEHEIEYPGAYNRFFVIAEYKNLPLNYQNGILKFLSENDKGDEGFSFVSKIPSRAKNIYCFGNFSGENNVGNNKDIAFIAEYNNYKTSRLVIMNANGDLLFTKEYSSLPIINSFKKGSKIYAGERRLVKSNYDGIILKEPDTKYVVIYDNKSKQFVEHYQYTESDLQEYNHYSEEDECADCDSVDTTEYN
ncbi:hypothetical protein [Empedobacter falsenii]